MGMRWLAVLVLVSGCALGAGPVAGYGFSRGAYWGIEGSGGLSVARAGVGWQSKPRSTHLRLESTFDRAWEGDSKVGTIGSVRVGAGYVVKGEGEGMMLAGPAVGYVFRDQRCGEEEQSTLIGTVSVDVRYIAGEWQLALAPRVETRTDPFDCWR